jgi:hypothetical protein
VYFTIGEKLMNMPTSLPPKEFLIRSSLISLAGAIVSAVMFAILEAIYTWLVSRYVDSQVSIMIFVGSSIFAVPSALIGGLWLTSKSYEQLTKKELERRRTVIYGMRLGAGFGFLASVAVLILINFRLDLLYFLLHTIIVLLISTSLGAFLGWANYGMLNGERFD